MTINNPLSWKNEEQTNGWCMHPWVHYAQNQRNFFTVFLNLILKSVYEVA